ncbi:efflux RND transporter periplasmic adaptor subunit [bacterium]|nr:efflux RND transporter periplasmic adaptor subunit [bacterium]
MHPQIKQPGPGQCPICAMDLIPVYADDQDQPLGPREIRLSPTAQKLAAVVTAPVQRRFVTMPVRLVGKIDYDETKLAYITAWVPGRLDRLYVDYTGVPVNKGDHLVDLYSPDLLAAQEELVQSLIAAAKIQDNGVAMIRDRAVATIDASREKLRLWGLQPEQIKEIERSGQPQDHLTIYAPVSGIVIHKNALEGMYVQTGSRIYTIADLAQVWVKLDAYESHLPWIHYGQEIEFETEAYPGEMFHGRIAFIDPVLDSRTRTVKVRVNVPNPDGRLKPEMFVRAVVRSRVAAEGKIIDPDLADKFICPMHPEVVKDQPGDCDVCGMDLVSAQSLGYVSAAAATAAAPLVIPATAPLITGKRAVVYVSVPGQPGVFAGREIVLGPRAGEQYIVRSGLREGEQVVVHGAFKIDSAVQIQAKPSMMSEPAPAQPANPNQPGPR